MLYSRAMEIRADVPSGNIEVVRVVHDRHVELALRPDSAADIKQWFSFQARVPRGAPIELGIVNAGEATYPHSWDGYRAFASYDGEAWERVPTTFDGKSLVLRHTPARRLVRYAYFADYPLSRCQTLVWRAAASRRARVTTVGESLHRRPIEIVEIGKVGGPPKRRIWVVTRQHPGETQGSWFMEGLVDRLLDERDAASTELLERAVFYLAPNLNPDGVERGNFRTNAAGSDLNREWQDPSDHASPEIACIAKTLGEVGVDMFLDVHGEESAPCAFSIGCEGNPHYTDRQRALERRFAEDLARRDRHFWASYGYGDDDPGKGDLRIGNNHVGEVYDCLSVTLEMPFKEGGRHPGTGAALSFSPEVARDFGRMMVETVAGLVGVLR